MSSALESVPSKSGAIVPTIRDVLREDKNDDDALRAGEVTVEERLAILGILVGASLLRLPNPEPAEGAD